MSRYPSNVELEKIESWDGTPRELIDFVASIWAYKSDRDWQIRRGRDPITRKLVYRVSFSTWGWSGNEDIVGALEGSWFNMLFWQSSRRGGHYEYEITPYWIDQKSPNGFGKILPAKA